jgi:NADPH-dependent curcumin reductase CurA
MAETLHRIVLARRPQGAPVVEDFRFETAAWPSPGPGEALVRTIWLSLDPYMRGRMNEGPSYAAPARLDEPMPGEAIGEVLESRSDSLVEGDIVAGHGGWQSHFVLPGEKLRKIDPTAAPLSTGLGVLGMPGMTAYTGLLGIGKPKSGETVVVSAASGAVGSVAGQIAKLKGCRAVGIAGGAEKCRYVETELGFDYCLDRSAPDLAVRLKDACPKGVDVYVELTGGEPFWTVLPILNLHARIPVIGTIAWYNLKVLPEGPDRTPLVMRAILTKRLHIEGMIVWDFAAMRRDFERDVAEWINDGRIKYKEDVVTGLDNAPASSWLR